MIVKANGLNNVGTDRRDVPRWHKDLRALWNGNKDKKTARCTIKSLSRDGATLCVNKDINAKQIVNLTINFLSGDCINITGSVPWVKETEDEQLVGVKFLNASVAVKESIISNLVGAGRARF